MLPFRPVSIPAFMFESKYGADLAAGTMSAGVGFRRSAQNRRAQSSANVVSAGPDGCILRDSTIDVSILTLICFYFRLGSKARERLGLFAIERDAPGVVIDDEVDLTTDATVARLMLRQCKIPNEQLLGYEYEAGAVIAAEQLNIAARCLGIAIRCLAASIEHARNRVTFGRRLAERQAIQWMLADLSVDVQDLHMAYPRSRRLRVIKADLFRRSCAGKKTSGQNGHSTPPIRRFKFTAATAFVKNFPLKGFIEKRA